VVVVRKQSTTSTIILLDNKAAEIRTAKMKPKDEDRKMGTADNGSLQTLQKHIEDMRSLVMCKICLKPFYEPYILACGHTYCYGCLNNWFSGNAERRKNNKNCPDCRTVVKVQPAPNYLLRDLTHMFIGRIELLPEDESVEEHNRDKNEEASLLTRDRNCRGLFGGLFKNVAPKPIMPYVPIRDYEDGVIRCPYCAWEIEDGICTGCGCELPGESDFSLSDSIDDEMSEESDSEGESAVSDLPIPQPPQQFYGVESDSEDDEDEPPFGSSQDPDNYDAHDDFIDDNNEVDADDMDGVDGYDGYPEEPGTPYSDGTSYTAQNDDEHEAWSNQQQLANMFGTTADVGFDSDVGEEDEEEEDDIRPASRQIRSGASGPVPAYRRRPIVISDDEEDVDEEGTPSPQARAPLPFSENEASGDGSEDENEDDDDGSGSSSSDSNAELASDNDSSESDDTIIPPQSSRDRRQRLLGHRARRPAPTNRVSIDLVTPPHPQHQPSHGRQGRSDVVRHARRNRVSVH